MTEYEAHRFRTNCHRIYSWLTALTPKLWSMCPPGKCKGFLATSAGRRFKGQLSQYAQDWAENLNCHGKQRIAEKM
eukprot:5311980-Pleurochrysis_carterae.AAC.1